ncbi:alkaline phosphatase family protein [Emcibacter sp. SYSU 3D8]|uniref:alkaline phosphatase family protein n=1 Tax=Emcibacter sp. SYSU 3D8 TaxID=3133969 RepID=UPI0031FF001F
MPAKVLFIGLDAGSAALVRRFAAEGAMPTFSRLERDGALCRLESPLRTLPGAIWPEIMTGISCGRMAEFYHPGQLHTGESRIRPISEEETRTERYFWTKASRAGRRVAAIDIPQGVLAPDLNGIQIAEWGVHDRNFRPGSVPPELMGEMSALYGDHPIQGRACDTLASQQGHDVLLDGLLKGCRSKADMMVDLLDREHWDLFACAFGETHCAGHQLWHLLDKSHPEHDPDAPQHLRDSMKLIYSAIDEGIGRLIDRAGTDTTVMVLTSHGVGPYAGGPQLLPEIMSRLGMSSHADSPLRRALRGMHNQARYLPFGIKRLLRKTLGFGALRRVQSGIGASFDPFESPRTRAGAVKNNRCGAIRLNLKGREPFGSVAPGAEAQALMAELCDALMSLTLAGTGKPIVESIVSAEDAFGPGHHPDVPDLIIRFRSDIGPIEACHSARVGHVAVPIRSPGYPRTGDHVPNTRLWAAGPDIRAGRRMPDGNVLDIAPTILHLLGVPAGDTDGKPLPLHH